MRIRRAVVAEALALSALAVQSKQHRGYSARDIQYWRAELAISADDIQSRPTFVAEVGESVAGFYSLVSAADAWVLEHLWVAPRFKRRGIGRALLTHAVETARSGGASAIAIDADPNAESFYVACGAVTRGAVPAPTVDDPGRTRPQLELRVGIRE